MLLCASGGLPYVPFYDVPTMKEQFSIPLPAKESGRVGQVIYEDDSREVIAVAVGQGSSSSVRVYDVSSRSEMMVLALSSTDSYGVVRALTVLPRSSSDPLIVTGFRRILIFNGRTGEELHRLPAPSNRHDTCRAIAVPEWNQPEVYIGAFEEFYRADVSRCVKLGTYRTGGYIDVTALTAIPTRNLILSVGPNETMQMWSRDEYRCVATLDLKVWTDALYYDEDKHMILAGCQNGDIQIWDSRQTGERVSRISLASSAHVYDIDRIDETSFVSGAQRSVATWNPTSGKIVAVASLKQPGSTPTYVYGVRVLRRGEREWSKDDEERLEFLLSSTAERRPLHVLLQELGRLEIWKSLVVKNEDG